MRFTGLHHLVIEPAPDQGLGDIVLITTPPRLQGMAICHIGAGTEAGGGNCYVKFGAVRPGEHAARQFELPLDACYRLAADKGATALAAGANALRDKAWKALAQRGFRTGMQAVTMHRPNDARLQPQRQLRHRRLALAPPWNESRTLRQPCGRSGGFAGLNR